MKKFFLISVIFLALSISFVAQTQAMQTKKPPTTEVKTSSQPRRTRNQKPGISDETLDQFIRDFKAIELEQERRARKPSRHSYKPSHDHYNPHHPSRIRDDRHNQRSEPIDERKHPAHISTPKEPKKLTREERLYDACKAGDEKEVKSLLTSKTPPLFSLPIINRAMWKSKKKAIHDILFDYLVAFLNKTEAITRLEEQYRHLKVTLDSERSDRLKAQQAQLEAEARAEELEAQGQFVDQYLAVKMTELEIQIKASKKSGKKA